MHHSEPLPKGFKYTAQYKTSTSLIESPNHILYTFGFCALFCTLSYVNDKIAMHSHHTCDTNDQDTKCVFASKDI
jgi:hypothetical protein